MIAARKSLMSLRLSNCTQSIKTISTLLSTSSTTFKNHVFLAPRSFSTTRSNEHLPDLGKILEYNEDIKNMSNEDLTDVTTIPGFTTLIHSMPRSETAPKNALVGKVVSDKMQKTVNVAVDRYKIIPKYRKRKKYTKKFFAHDEHETCAVGDLVMIVPCQRLSRHKHFIVHEIIKRKGMFKP